MYRKQSATLYYTYKMYSTPGFRNVSEALRTTEKTKTTENNQKFHTVSLL